MKNKNLIIKTFFSAMFIGNMFGVNNSIKNWLDKNDSFSHINDAPILIGFINESKEYFQSVYNILKESYSIDIDQNIYAINSSKNYRKNMSALLQKEDSFQNKLLYIYCLLELAETFFKNSNYFSKQFIKNYTSEIKEDIQISFWLTYKILDDLLQFASDEVKEQSLKSHKDYSKISMIESLIQVSKEKQHKISYKIKELEYLKDLRL